MAEGVRMIGWNGPSRRRVPRFPLQAPVDFSVLRSGIPDTLPGRSMNMGERGVAAVVAGELVPGETVGVEINLPTSTEPLRTRAMVKYQHELRCGLEFVSMSPAQRSVIRDWAKEHKPESETTVSPPASTVEKQAVEPPQEGSSSSGAGQSRGPKWKLKFLSLIALVLIVLAAGAWWKWNRSWLELESGLRNGSSAEADKPRAQVPAEVMEKLLVHRVEPVYPPEARKENLQGIIALDIVVGRDGSVIAMHPLNGPDVLARAAMDALRWWKFEPYRMNGEPVAVESRVAVEFKR
ncbi:MAG TPA: energy transducer TonB [Candidatus Sulfotelmatobacter sp.]|nr:energy transducer TonB [Candidatus Sulfotelmatobacter sp.]